MLLAGMSSQKRPVNYDYAVHANSTVGQFHVLDIVQKFPLEVRQPSHVPREPQSAEQSCEMKAEECNAKAASSTGRFYEDPIAFLPSPGLLPGSGSTHQDI